MDHLPFEDWILNNEPLTPRQKRELAAHLKACRTCTALGEVDLALANVRQAEPAPGFTARFQARLVEQRKTIKRRNTLGFSLLAVSVVGVSLVAAWPFLQALVASPLQLATTWMTSLAGLWVSIQALLQAGLVLLRVAPGFVPGYIWAVIILGLASWSIAWTYSMLRFTRITQGA
jgi:hypothetical protein